MLGDVAAVASNCALDVYGRHRSSCHLSIRLANFFESRLVALDYCHSHHWQPSDTLPSPAHGSYGELYMDVDELFALAVGHGIYCERHMRYGKITARSANEVSIQ